MSRPFSPRARSRGFTLVELLVSMTVVALLMGVLLQTVFQTQVIWTGARNRVEEFREARVAFEAITRRLSQATLNSVWDYDNPASPTRYQRYSDLHFVTGPSHKTSGGQGLLQTVTDTCGHAVFFQAPMGFAGQEVGGTSASAAYDNMEELLNGWGFYVQYRSDLPDRPEFLRNDSGPTGRNPERKNFSLMEFRQPSESLPVFLQGTDLKPLLATQTASAGLYSWFRNGNVGSVNPPVACDINTGSRVLARNILALIISPRVPTQGVGTACDYDIAPSYFYDSREFQMATPTNSGTDRNGTQLIQASRHQLPPVLEVTLVALDDASWGNYLEGGGDESKYLEYVRTHFQSVGTVTNRNSSSYEGTLRTDLANLESMLAGDRVAYRIFSSSVELRSAKWTTDADLPATASTNP